MGKISQFDRSLLDEFLLDDFTDAPDDPSESTDDFTFDGYGLMNSAVFISEMKASGPTREISAKAYPRADGAYVENSQWRENTVTLQGIIKKTTRNALELEMDTMRKRFAVPAGVLKITHAGVARYYDCYANGLESLFADRQGYQTTVVPWTQEFVSFHPFARSLARQYYSFPTGITAEETTVDIPHDGSAPTESNIYLMLTTAGTASKVRWENTETGEAIEISASFDDGDYIRIDGENKVAYVNGVSTDYDGVFPTVSAGGSSMKLTITGSGFSASMSENHYKRYH